MVFVIEFFGMPRAGKTTCIEVMESYLKSVGKKVRIIYEGARVSPLDKSDRFNYNAWSFHNTINRVLEAKMNNHDFILIDRGVLDHISFLGAISLFCGNKNLDASADYCANFLDLQTVEVFFDVSIEESIRRESKHKYSIGRIFNSDFLTKLRESYLSVLKDFPNRNIICINGDDEMKINMNKIISLTDNLLLK